MDITNGRPAMCPRCRSCVLPVSPRPADHLAAHARRPIGAVSAASVRPHIRLCAAIAPVRSIRPLVRACPG